MSVSTSKQSTGVNALTFQAVGDKFMFTDEHGGNGGVRKDENSS